MVDDKVAADWGFFRYTEKTVSPRYMYDLRIPALVIDSFARLLRY